MEELTLPIPSEDRQRTTQQTSDYLQVAESCLRKKKPKQRSRRDRRIERLAQENRELKLRIRKLEDRLKEPMRQLVARKREEKQDEKE